MLESLQALLKSLQALLEGLQVWLEYNYVFYLGETLFNTLWLSLDMMAEMDLRSTNIFSCVWLGLAHSLSSEARTG